MNNFEYFKITKSKKIRYLKISKKKGDLSCFSSRIYVRS